MDNQVNGYHMPDELINEFQHFLLMVKEARLNRFLRMLFLDYCDHLDSIVPPDFSDLIMEMSQLFEFMDKVEDLSPYTEERYLGRK